MLASFPGSPSFRAIIPCMTFDPPQRSKVIHGIIARKEGEPGNEATLMLGCTYLEKNLCWGALIRKESMLGLSG